MRRSSLFLLSLGHFLVDSYASLLAPLMPLISDRLGLNLAHAGLLGTIVSLTNLSQPLLGLWADRMARRYLVVGGLFLSAACSPLLGVAPTYGALVVVLGLGGLGVAAFHPQAFSLAGEMGGPQRSFGLALFLFGGSVGLALTPFWVPYWAERMGLGTLPLTMLPGALAAVVFLKLVPLDNPHLQAGRRSSLWASLEGQARPLAVITAIVALRSVTSVGFGFYLTMLGKERGLTLVAGSVSLGLYNVAGVVGGLVTGYLAGRLAYRPLVWVPLLLSVPGLYGFLHTTGVVSYLLLIAGGGLVLASSSILVAMAQELAPANSGLASSLPLGLSWGLASLALPVIGAAADRIGVAGTLEYLAVLPVATAALGLLLPGGKTGTIRRV
jgi:FSR family fosmidomycin resistance protein-like MFS transporter